MKKISNTSTIRKTSKKEKVRWQDYYNLHQMKMCPISEDGIRIICEDFTQWADLDDSLRIEDFFDSRGICDDTWIRWKNTYDWFAKAHRYAMRRLASRREKGAITRRFDGPSIYKTLAWYDPVYRAEQERLAKLKIEVESQDKNKRLTVELNVVEKTPDVKPLENE